MSTTTKQPRTGKLANVQIGPRQAKKRIEQAPREKPREHEIAARQLERFVAQSSNIQITRAVPDCFLVEWRAACLCEHEDRRAHAAIIRRRKDNASIRCTGGCSAKDIFKAAGIRW
ncbi:hypothetical protein ACFL02_07840 [Planctomycetota bacterium]